MRHAQIGRPLRSLTIAPSLNTRLPYDPQRDFAPITLIGYQDLVLVVNPSVPAKTLEELVALAKAKPGQINYASSGIGTVYHMSGELLKTTADIEIVHVPHRASGDMRNSVLGGHVQMMFDAITTIEPMIRAGQVRTIATTGLKRAPSTPDVPTMSESGAEGFETNIWFGLMAPAGTPPEVVEKLDGEVHRALARPEIGAVWSAQGVTPWTVSRTTFDKFLRDDIAKWEKVVKATGVKLN